MSMINDANRKWWALASLCCLVFLINFDLTGINLAIPVIAHDLNANLADMQWVINGYALMSAIFTVIGGRLADMWGYRRMYTIGIGICVVASLVAGLATTEMTLIIARFVQGFSIGMATPVTMAILFNMFPKRQQGYAMGILMSSLGLAAALGPTLGGIIVHLFSWRWIFLVNIPAGIITIWLIMISVPKDGKIEEKQAMDWMGATFVALAMLGIIIGLNEVQDWGWNSLKFILTFGGGILALIILYFIERKQKFPVFKFDFFKLQPFWINTVVRFVSQLIFVPLLFFVPIYLQNISGYSVMMVGVIMLFATIVMGVLSPYAGKWIDKVGVKLPNLISMAMYAIASLMLFTLDAKPNIIVLGIALMIVGLATGLCWSSTPAGAMGVIPPEESGTGSGVFFGIAWVSCAFGIAITGTVLALVGRAALLKQFALNHLTFPDHMTEFYRIVSGLEPLSELKKYFPANQLHEITPIFSQAFMKGFHYIMLTMFAMSVLGFFVALMERKDSAPHYDTTEMPI